jgi:hypothetical protein
MKRLLRALLSLVIVGGIGVALWPLGQIAYARWNQNALRAEWQQAAQETGSKAARTHPARRPRLCAPLR